MTNTPTISEAVERLERVSGAPGVMTYDQRKQHLADLRTILDALAERDRLAEALAFAVRSASRRHDGKYEMHPSVYAAMEVALSHQPESDDAT